MGRMDRAWGVLLNTSNAIHGGALSASGQIAMSGDGKSKIELRPDLDPSSIFVWSKPDMVYRGAVSGFSLPVYAADNEELFFSVNVPNRWDGESNIVARLMVWLDTANTDKNFQMQLSWNHYSAGDVVPNSVHDIEIETATGTAAQYKSFEVLCEIDYDIDTPDNILADDSIGLRLRRIAASANEITGEVVVEHVGLVFNRDKMGAPA